MEEILRVRVELIKVTREKQVVEGLYNDLLSALNELLDELEEPDQGLLQEVVDEFCEPEA